VIDKFFATPVYHTNLDHEALRQSLNKLILSRQTSEFEHPNPPQGRIPGVFESRFNFFLEQENTAIADLTSLINTHLQAFLAVVTNSKPEEIDLDTLESESWFHITEQGGYFQPHTHPNASWSVVYCVDNGHTAETSAEEESGHLVFSDPRTMASMFLDPFNRNLHRDISFNGVKYFLQSGDLVFFPSYLEHFVAPFSGEGKRITVAANFHGIGHG